MELYDLLEQYETEDIPAFEKTSERPICNKTKNGPIYGLKIDCAFRSFLLLHFKVSI